MAENEQNATSIAVLGAGTMGAGIAQIAATTGHSVMLYDILAPKQDQARKIIAGSLERMVKRAKLSAEESAQALSRITFTDSLEQAVTAAQLIVEAVPERMDLKKELFQAVETHASPSAILASNTSSLSITELGATTKDAGRFVGLHFFNPVPVMELVEIVVGERTRGETLVQAREWVARLGKTAIVVNDFPGFATSRLGVVIGAEAIRMLEQGVASVQDIDRAMELGYRHPMGPLRLGDLVGLDVRLAILEHLHKELGEQFRPPALLRRMVRAGKLGKKSGEGFYRWEGDTAIPVDPRGANH